MNTDDWNHKIRHRLASQRLSERRKIAEAMGWPDGVPLSEADVRMNIRRARDAGQDRTLWLYALRGDPDPMKRRLGALNPEEVRSLFDQEWPEHE